MSYVGSPMYEVTAEHAAALLSIPVVLGLLTFARRSQRQWSTAYRGLPAVRRLLVSLVAIDATMHLFLGPTHGGRLGLALFSFGVVGWVLARRLILGSTRSAGTIVWALSGLAAYAVAAVSGRTTVDQVGTASKLLELAALASVLVRVQRVRFALGSAGLVATAVMVAAASWAGAMEAGGHGHELGEVPAPGVLLPQSEDRDPTPAEVAAAARFHRTVAAAIAPYQSLAAAAEAGFAVENLAGSAWHADNPVHKADGRIFDPEAPETLVYAEGPDGPVLVGAMFQMDGLRNPGPAIGGPLTVWHAHDHVCLSLVPLGLAGLTGPFGSCPPGTITIPLTNEMIHVWTVPGAPEPFGDLDETWLEMYLSSAAG